MSQSGSPPPAREDDAPKATEHLNIKVTDNQSEVFFKIKRTTQLKKLMDAFCERSGKTRSSCRFLFDGQRVTDADSPDTVSAPYSVQPRCDSDVLFFLLARHVRR